MSESGEWRGGERRRKTRWDLVGVFGLIFMSGAFEKRERRKKSPTKPRCAVLWDDRGGQALCPGNHQLND